MRTRSCLSGLAMMGMLTLAIALACSDRGTGVRSTDSSQCDARYLQGAIQDRLSRQTPVRFLEASYELVCSTDAVLDRALGSLIIDNYKKAFLRAAVLMNKGRFAESGTLLSNLVNSPDGREWGLVGMAEHAIRRGHVRDLGWAVTLLGALAETADLISSRWDFLHYKMYFLMETGLYEEAQEIMAEEATPGDARDSEERTYTDVLLKLNLGRYEEAEGMLASLEAPQSDERDYDVFRADIVRIMEGPRKLLSYLEGLRMRYPDDKYVLYQYALALIDNDGREEGLDIVRRVALTLPFDVNMVADYVDFQEGTPETAEARRALQLIETSEVTIPRFELTMARRAYERGDLDEMNEHLQVLEAAHPLYEDYLWFLYHVNWKARAYDRCREVLARLARVDPESVDVLVEKARTESRLRNRKEGKRLLDLLKSSPRFKDPAVVQELERELSEGATEMIRTH